MYILKHWLALLFQPKYRNRDRLLNRQKKKLQTFADQTLILAPYYQKLQKKGYTIDDFPIITKTEFMTHFNEINTVGLDRDTCMKAAIAAELNKTFDSEINGYTVGLSTGTSGNRGIFIASEEERAQWAAQIFYKVVKPKLFQKQKVAFCLRANSDLYESVKSSLFSFQFYDIATPINQIIAGLEQRKPDILCAQPSLLLLLVQAKQKGKLNIEPKQIISYAEVLDVADKTLINQVFQAQITEIYQCTEGFLGYTCSHGTMHLNEDNIRFERQMLDEYRFQPILTDFVRKSQPVVRYLLNDVLVLKKDACPCGSAFTAIERIEGRTDDVLVSKSTKGELVYIFPDLVRRRIVWAAEKTRAYAAEQLDFHTLNIYLDIEDQHFKEESSKIEKTLADLFLENGVQRMEFNFQQNLPPRKQEEKLRRVKRIFSLEK